MVERINFDEQFDPEIYCHAIGRLTEAELLELAEEAEKEGLSKESRIIRRLVTHAELIVNSQFEILTEDEVNTACGNMFLALYELGDVIGNLSKECIVEEYINADDGNDVRTKPFTLKMTEPRVHFIHPKKVLPASAKNLIDANNNSFITSDPQTKRLMDYLCEHDDSSAPSLSLALELTSNNDRSKFNSIKQRVASISRECGYNLRVREIDLATALQSGIQGSRRPVLLHTTAKGPNGGNIIVTSFPGIKLTLAEAIPSQGVTLYHLHGASISSSKGCNSHFGDINSVTDFHSRPIPVTSLIIERPLLPENYMN